MNNPPQTSPNASISSPNNALADANIRSAFHPHPEVAALRERLGIDPAARREHNKIGAEFRLQKKLEREQANGTATALANGSAPTTATTAATTRPTPPAPPPATAPPSPAPATPPPAEGLDPTASPATPAEPVQGAPEAAWEAERAGWTTERTTLTTRATAAETRAQALEGRLTELMVTSALTTARVRNLEATGRLIDRGKLAMDESGALTGLGEQIVALQKDFPGMFFPGSTGSAGNGTGNGTPSGHTGRHGSTAAKMDAAIRSKMRG